MSYKCLAFSGQEDFLSNIVHLSNVGSMLGQRRRRWTNIKTALDQCLVWVVSCNQFSGYINAVNLYSIGYCWPTLDRPRHARFEAEWFFKICLVSAAEFTHSHQTSGSYTLTIRASPPTVGQCCVTLAQHCATAVPKIQHFSGIPSGAVQK